MTLSPNHPRDLRFLRFILVLTGCLHLCGGHYGVVQMFAWGKMIVDYSSEKGVVAAVSDTFDGEHPCELCKSIAKAKKDDTKLPRPPAKTDGKGFELKNFLPAKLAGLSEPRPDPYRPAPFLSPEDAKLRFLPRPEMPPPRLA